MQHGAIRLYECVCYYATVLNISLNTLLKKQKYEIKRKMTIVIAYLLRFYLIK